MYLSIEFGSNIKIVEGYKKKDLLMISKAVTLNTSSEFYNGNIVVMDLANLIKDAFVKNNIKAKKAVFVINSESVIIRRIKLPLLKKSSEILSMIKIELGQLVPADISRYKLIYKIIDTYDECGIVQALYAVYCMPDSLYRQYMQLAKLLHLKLICLDISSNCLNKIREHNLEINGAWNSEGVAAFVGIDLNRVSFCTLNKGINDFFRIASYVNDYEYNDGMSAQFEEISKTIRWYNSIDSSKINKIYIYGTCPDIWSFEKLLSSNLNIDAEAIKNISNIIFKENLPISEYFIPVIALFDVKALNFLSYEKECCRVLLMRSTVIAVLIFCSLFFFLGNSLSIHREIKAISLFINDEEKIIQSMTIEKLKEENLFLKNQINNIEDIMSIINNEFVYPEALRKISGAIPENTRVVSFSADSSSVDIQCISEAVSEIILLLNNLTYIDFIENIYIPEVQSAQGEKYSYSVLFNLKDVHLIEK